MISKPPKTSLPIDQIRNAAISMEIGAGDGDRVLEMITVGEALYVIRGTDIYTMILADQIDPHRTNIQVPNAQQKVCDYGANDQIVGATLLTAKRLMQPVYQKDLNHAEAMKIVFNYTQDLIGLRSIADKLNAEINSALEELDTNRTKFVVPHTNNLVSDLRTYFEKTKQLFNQWFEVIKMFFPDVPNGQPTKLLEYLDKVFPGEHPFKADLKHSLEDFEYLSNGRNAVVHPKSGIKELQVFDYSLKPDHTLLKPVFGLLYPNIEYKIWDVASFVSEMTLALIEYTEHLIAMSACYSPTAKDAGGFPKNIAMLPSELQRYNVRYTYTITLNGEDRILG